MKKAVIVAISLIAIFGVLGAVDAVAAAFPPALGGTGTTATPLPGQVLIGTGSGTYTPAYILCAGTCSVSSASGTITITGTGVATNTGNWAGTWQLYHPSDFVASSTQIVNTVNGSSGTVTITSSTLGVIWPTVNGNKATNYNIVPGTGVTSTVSGATTTISVSLNNGSTQTCSANQFINSVTSSGIVNCGSITFPTAATYTFTQGSGISITQATSSSNTTTTVTNTGVLSLQSSSQVNVSAATGSNIQLTLALNYLTAALLTLNGMNAPNQTVIAGTGLSYATSTSGLYATTTLTLNIDNGSTQTCSANQFVNQVNATGITSCGSITFPASITQINGATSSVQTISGGSGISVSTLAGASNSTTTVTNTGVTSFAGAGCVTAANSTGSVALAVTCISGNQTITFTINGDATGTASGTTAVTDSITVTGLNGKVLPANTTGTLQFANGAWAINLATSSLGLYNASGSLSSYLGSSCSGGQFVTGFSANGTVACGSPSGAGTVTQLTAGTGISLTPSNPITSTGTITNTGVTSFTGQNCVTSSNSTGTVTLTVSCISGNQNITFTVSGDATGTASGTTSINDSITVTGLNGKVLPANTTGTLQFTSGAWKISVATSSLGLYDASGTLSSYTGSISCGMANTSLTSFFVQSISANGTTVCSSAPATAINSLNSATGTYLLVANSPLSYATSSTSTILTCPTCLTANQTITVTATGEATGTATGTTSISLPLVLKSPVTENVSTTQVTATALTAGTSTINPYLTIGSSTVITSTTLAIIANANLANSIVVETATGTLLFYVNPLGATTIANNLNVYPFGLSGTDLFFQSNGTTGVQFGGYNNGFTPLLIDGNPIYFNTRGGNGPIYFGQSTTTVPVTFYGSLTQSSGTVSLATTSVTDFTDSGVTNAIPVAGSGGHLSAYGGSTTSGGSNCLLSVTESATGTLSNTNGACSGAGGGATTTISGVAGPTFTFNTNPTTSTAPSVTTSSATVNINIPNTQHIQSWTVGPTGATGVDFTSIQNALNACGTAGGGTIYLLAGTYAQAGTGLQWKGSNCKIYGDYGSSTITFTGATTLFSTASSGAEYSHNEIHNLTITGDSNTSDVGIAESNMSHGVYDNLTIDAVGSCFQLHDTVDITFYNTTSNIDCTTVAKYGIDGSSTEPWNGNLFQNIFIGCSTSGCISILDGNSEHNTFENIYEEPAGAPLTSSIGVDIFDTNIGSNPGNFGNLFINNYLEGNATAVKVAAGASCGAGECILGDMFIGGISDTNGTLTLPTSTGVTFLNFNNNFQPETTLSSHVGITGITTMPSVGTCGTSPAIDSHSNDNVGLLTVGTAAPTSCKLTFAISWPIAPVCTANIASGTAAAITAKAIAASVTFTTVAAMATNTQIAYHCLGDNSQN